MACRRCLPVITNTVPGSSERLCSILCTSVELVSGQMILKRYCRHLVLKTSSFLFYSGNGLPTFWSIQDTQDIAFEDPVRNWMRSPADFFLTDLSMVKTWLLALLTMTLNPWSNLQSVATLLPRNTKSLMSPRCLHSSTRPLS